MARAAGDGEQRVCSKLRGRCSERHSANLSRNNVPPLAACPRSAFTATAISLLWFGRLVCGLQRIWRQICCPSFGRWSCVIAIRRRSSRERRVGNHRPNAGKIKRTAFAGTVRCEVVVCTSVLSPTNGTAIILGVPPVGLSVRFCAIFSTSRETLLLIGLMSRIFGACPATMKPHSVCAPNARKIPAFPSRQARPKTKPLP